MVSNMPSIEQINRKQTDAAVQILLESIADVDREISRIVNAHIESILSDSVSESEADIRFRAIEAQYGRLDETFRSFIQGVIPVAFGQGVQEMATRLQGRVRSLDGVDVRAINALIQSSIGDFHSAVTMGRDRMQTFFRISKQRAITEIELENIIARGLISRQNGRFARQLLNTRFDNADRALRIVDDNRLAKSRQRRLRQLRRAIMNRGNINEGLRDWMLNNEIEKLNNQKYLQIVDKRGRVITYRTDTYASLVTRTKYGQAQVDGSINEAVAYDVDTFRISSHNSKTPYDRSQEGKVYTLNKKKLNKAGVDGMLTERRKPLYHPNCLHRLNPVVIDL